MDYLLDTNAVSDLVSAVPAVRENFQRAANEGRILACPIVIAEIRFGLERLPPGVRKDQLREKVSRTLERLELVVIDGQVASAYVQIRLERTAAGRPMIDNDLWIAATAKAAGLVLVTRDRDFRDIDGLTVADWTISPSGR